MCRTQLCFLQSAVCSTAGFKLRDIQQSYFSHRVTILVILTPQRKNKALVFPLNFVRDRLEKALQPAGANHVSGCQNVLQVFILNTMPEFLVGTKKKLNDDCCDKTSRWLITTHNTARCLQRVGWRSTQEGFLWSDVTNTAVIEFVNVIKLLNYCCKY